MARVYAKLVTANGEKELSHAELDQLRMLISHALDTGELPEARPPVRPSQYRELCEWISADFDKNRGKETEYLDGNEHQFEVGDFALDSTEPTPSPEANTVKITELTNERADQFVIEETGKTVAEHNPAFPPDDLVVAGHYPHMGGENKTFHFPESRLYDA